MKIAPGVRLNFNKGSTSVTFGGKGAKYTVNSSGKKTASVGLPGTGVSYSTTVGDKDMSAAKRKSKNKLTGALAVPLLVVGLIAGAGGGEPAEQTPDDPVVEEQVVEQQPITELPGVVESDPEEMPTKKPTEETTKAPEEPVEKPAETPVDQPAEKSEDPPVEEPPAETVVYITETGSKYHRGGCRHLSDSKIEISLSSAVKQYDPCGTCKPPTN